MRAGLRSLLVLLITIGLFLALIRGTLAVELSVDSTASQKIDYTLAYPGILPNHPLYFLKVFRDQVVYGLIRETKDKGFYNLLQADKRVRAAEMLFEKGDKKLGAITASKAEEYYAKAVEDGVATKDKDLVPKIAVAGAKHSEVFQSLLRQATEGDAELLQTAIEDNQNQRNRIMNVIVGR